MNAVQYLRRGNVVREVATQEDTVFESINKAKKHIRELTHSSGADNTVTYRHGAARVVDKFPSTNA